MLYRAFRIGRFALGGALWFLITVPALTGCASAGRTAQERKTERYKRRHKPGTPIPCPTKDC